MLILGCGFTGRRVADHLLARGAEVTATTRDPQSLAAPHRERLRIQKLALDPANPLADLSTLVGNWDAIVYSIPTLRVDNSLMEPAPLLLRALSGSTSRCIYLSTTGVYGKQKFVDASTQAAPETERERLRVEAELAVLQHFREPLVLRPAAIYGPGRGVHVSMRMGKYRLSGDGHNYISRIHVDDLAAHVVAALRTRVTGAWPVTDEEPCSQRTMAEYCASLLALPLPPSAHANTVSETLRANRQVDGSGIRQKLGISLQYPTYRQGIPAAIAAEALASE